MRVAVLLIASLLAFALPVMAQDEASSPPPHSLKPQPALTAPLAAKYRLIDITNTGERLVAVGQRGNIVISDDGKHWKQVASPVNVMLTRVRFLDAQRGWIVGHDGAILHSADGGKSWRLQHYNAEARQLYDILMLDAQNGIAVGGYGSYLVTGDGGNTWTAQASPLSELALHLNTLIRLSDGTLFIAGEKSLMAWSSDQGATWQMLNSPYTGSFFGAVPLNEGGVLVYGMRGRVYMSKDVKRAAKQDPATFDPATRVMTEDATAAAKLGWRMLSGGLRESMFGAELLPDGEVILVGINGLAQKTNLASATLTPLRVTAAATLSDVLPVRGQLIAVGKQGVVNLGTLR